MLTIDLSLRSTGYCVWKDSKLIKYGVIATDNKDSPFKRAKFISDELITLILDNKISSVKIEGPAFMARGAMTYVLMGVHFHVVANISNQVNIECIQIPPTSLKKLFTGKGNAKKELMIESMPKDVLTMFSKQYVKSRGLTDLVDAYALGWTEYNKLKEE